MHKGTNQCRLSLQNKWTTISWIETKEWEQIFCWSAIYESWHCLVYIEKMSALVVRTVSWIKLCPSVNACLFHFRRRNVFSKNMSYSKSSRFGFLYCFVTSLMMQRLLNMQKSKRENYDKKPLHLLWIIQVKRYLYGYKQTRYIFFL